MWDEIAPDAQAARTRQQLAQPVDLSPPPAGVFDNAISGAGRYFMRSMAEAGRGLSMAAAAVPVLADKIVGDDNFSGKPLADQYFKLHDETFNSAVDHWTPKPGEVGVAGEVLGSLAGNMVQFFANPALALNTAQMSTGEDLVRQGVDPYVAAGAGNIAALGTAAGIKIPIVGNTLGQRVAAGVVGNVAQGMATSAATSALLKTSGAPEQVAAQFDPFDLKARSIDAMMGAVFGVSAHIGAPKQELTQSQKDALLLVNQARHIEDASTPGRPATEADLTKTVTATRAAIDQMLRGDPVAVEGLLREVVTEPDAAKQAMRSEIEAVVKNDLPKPAERIEIEPMQSTTGDPATQAASDKAPAPTGGAGAAEPTAPAGGVSEPRPGAAQAAGVDAGVQKFDESVRLPTGEFNPKTGEPVTISANDYVAQAHAEAADAKARSVGLFQAAANCLLGGI